MALPLTPFSKGKVNTYNYFTELLQKHLADENIHSTCYGPLRTLAVAR